MGLRRVERALAIRWTLARLREASRKGHAPALHTDLLVNLLQALHHCFVQVVRNGPVEGQAQPVRGGGQ